MFDLDGRIIDAESSHRASPVKQKRGDEPKRKRGTRQQPRSANEQDTPPLELTLELTPVKVCYGFLKHRYFIAGLIKAPEDLTSHLLEEHEDIIKQITGVSFP